MTNLLPLEAKENLLKEKKIKEIIILGSVVFLSLVCLSLVLLVVKVSLESRLLFEKAILAHREKEFQSSEIKKLEERAISLNKMLSEIDSFYQRKIHLVDTFEKLSAITPEGILLTSISYQKGTRGISLSGFSPDRETLLKFKEMFEQEKSLTDIYFPASNWINPREIDFLVNFKIR